MNLNQFMALVRLRFQLSLNQIRKGGAVNSILASIISVGLIIFAISSFLGTIVFGGVWLRQLEVDRILGLWNIVVMGFLTMWSFYLMNRIHQNDVISMDKLLHLPTTFHGAFLLNFLSTFTNLTMLSVAPTIIGLAIAMPIARGWSLAIAIPLTLSFLFMVVAITYQLRSWLSEKMQNKRTRGMLMAVLPLIFIGLFIASIELTKSHSLKDWLTEIPLGWLPSGIVNAEAGNLISGAIGTLTMSAIGCVSLFFAYQSSMRKFTGAGSSNTSGSSKAVVASNWGDSRMFSPIPFVSQPVAAIAIGTMQSLRRSPEIFAAMLPVIVLVIFGTPYLIGMEGYVLPDWMAGTLQPGLITVALLGFPAFLFSTFSYDRDGLRAYILSPIPREDILFGKNLAIGIATVAMGWLTMIVAQCFFPTGPLWFLGSLISLPASYLLLCIAGNAVSIFYAVGLKRGSMTPVNAQVIPIVALYLGVLFGPILALLPTMAAFSIALLLEPTTGFSMGFLYVFLSILSLCLSWWVYRKSLILFGPLLWSRETGILNVVANIPE